MRLLILILFLSMTACGNSRSKRSKSDNSSANGTANNVVVNGGTAICGNGAVEAGERCDSAITDGVGACPTECRAPACSTASLTGAPSTCDAQCTVQAVGCVDGDGCCTIGCDATTDSDCTNICGDGMIAENELCDGNCPTSCGSPNACAIVELVGDPSTCSAQCIESSIELCQGGDGCCPTSCNANNDPDCGAGCGNGTLEPGESCDGDCPTSCDDGVACTQDILAGSPDTCNVVCVNQEIGVCVGGDGCCPAGCTNANDSDCSATCGNGQIDAGETCDGNCPTSCGDGDACTNDVLRGSAASCSARCSYERINVCTGGDGCCPSGCTNANDSDCACTPDSCQTLGIECGPADNGCGGTIQCGACSSGTCNTGMCDGGEPATTVVGSPCARDSDCTDTLNDTPFCITSAEGYPGGYCSASCQFLCTYLVSACVSAGPIGLLGASCYAQCAQNSDCRSGYSCQDVETLLLGIISVCLPQ